MSPQEKKDQPTLRQRAEAIAGVQPETMDHLSKEEIRALFQELQVHEIELALQNEELRNAQRALEEARRRYFHLFQNAPVGYVVLDAAGIISQVNRTFAHMLGHDSSLLKGRAFADCLMPEDAAVFRARFKSFLKSDAPKRLTVRLRSGETPAGYAQLETAGFLETDGDQGGRLEALSMTVSDVTDQVQAGHEMETALEAAEMREREVQALLKGAHAVLVQSDFQTTARHIFDVCRELLGATSGYVALLSADGKENELLFLEDGGMPCDVNPDLPMPVRGLRAEAYRTCRAVYDNDFMHGDWVRYMPQGHMALTNVLFAPLVLDGEAVGILGLANKPGGFTPADARLAVAFGELAAVALQNSRYLETKIKAEAHLQKTNQELRVALSQVKQLRGLLPICSHCKKIRDDQGYWNQLESYIGDHTEAEFSHSICPDCVRRYYPDFDLSDDRADSLEKPLAVSKKH